MYKARLLAQPNKTTEIQSTTGITIKFPGQEHMSTPTSIEMISPNPGQYYPIELELNVNDAGKIDVTPIDMDWITYYANQIAESYKIWRSKDTFFDKWGGTLTIAVVAIGIILILSVGMQQYFQLVAKNSALQSQIMDFSREVMGYVAKNASYYAQNFSTGSINW